jgi:hypothetical protein
MTQFVRAALRVDQRLFGLPYLLELGFELEMHQFLS